jgi:CDP-diacylglycerol pyrophosphatase
MIITNYKNLLEEWLAPGIVFSSIIVIDNVSYRRTQESKPLHISPHEADVMSYLKTRKLQLICYWQEMKCKLRDTYYHYRFIL